MASETTTETGVGLYRKFLNTFQGLPTADAKAEFLHSTLVRLSQYDDTAERMASADEFMTLLRATSLPALIWRKLQSAVEMFGSPSAALTPDQLPRFVERSSVMLNILARCVRLFDAEYEAPSITVSAMIMQDHAETSLDDVFTVLCSQAPEEGSLWSAMLNLLVRLTDDVKTTDVTLLTTCVLKHARPLLAQVLNDAARSPASKVAYVIETLQCLAAVLGNTAQNPELFADPSTAEPVFSICLEVMTRFPDDVAVHAVDVIDTLCYANPSWERACRQWCTGDVQATLDGVLIKFPGWDLKFIKAIVAGENM